MVSSSSALSDALCLRFSPALCPVERWWAVVAADGCSEALAAGSGVLRWAEIAGEEEAGEFGVAGRSEAIRG